MNLRRQKEENICKTEILEFNGIRMRMTSVRTIDDGTGCGDGDGKKWLKRKNKRQTKEK